MARASQPIDIDQPSGVAEHRRQILLLVVTNAFVGGMVGLERTVLPLLAEAEFGVATASAALSFIATFGLTKAAANFFAGGLADRWGRKPLLVAGWLVALPIPVLLMVSPSWGWVLLANVLLGVNQSLTWSMTVVMKVDRAGPRRYGFVIGWNEFAGYLGLALVAVLTGVIAANQGLRPEPFYLGVGIATVGLVLSLFARETKAYVQSTKSKTAEAKLRERLGRALRLGTWGDRTLAASSLAGLTTNLKDGAMWGLLPMLLVSRGLPLDRVGLVVGLYPGVWAVSQLYFGPLSDRVGRRTLIGAGLALQGVGVALFAMVDSYGGYLAASSVVGIGTGMVYPTLLALVSDVANPDVRASALGVYRLWRDSGYAVGALGAGMLADAAGVSGSVMAVGGLSLAVGVVFAVLATDGSD